MRPFFPPPCPVAADKPFERANLAEAAIKLEAQIKSDAGTAGKPLAQIRRELDAAFKSNDFRNGMVLLGQLVAAAPADSAGWLRLARTIQQIRPADERERTLLLDRAGTAAYKAYTLTKNRGEEADSLAHHRPHPGRPEEAGVRRSTRCGCRSKSARSPRCAALYESMRNDHGFRMLDYSIDADAASPRACFQFSETLPAKRTDFSPFVAVAGIDKPALSVEQKQLCVEGLKHGERYSVTLRAGLPSTVHETLAKSAEMSIYVRDRTPLVRFSAKAYVLPRTGQRGIPVVTVNTRAVTIEIYRIGDRNLLDTVLGNDFQRSLDGYDVERLAESRGVSVWKGELAVEQTLNAEVTTAFPVDQAVGDLAPGVYVMTAIAGRLEAGAPLRQPRDAMVHRVRPRPRVLFRQRRHQRVRQFAGDHRAEGAGRGAPDRAQQRNPRHQAQRRGRPRHVRGRA